MISGLEHALFARYGSLHRNTYIHSPTLLHKTLQMKNQPRLFCAGQITGVEGYIESAAMGLVAGIQAGRYVRGQLPVSPPATTMLGSLLSYLTETKQIDFQPMNANFGLLPALPDKVRKKDRKRLLAERALHAVEEWSKNVRSQT